MFIVLVAFLIKGRFCLLQDAMNVHVSAGIHKGYPMTTTSTNQPVCLNGDIPIQLSGNEELGISFKVYNPTEFIKVGCLDKRSNVFDNCSRFNLFVESSSFYVQYGTIPFLVFGHTINMTFAGKDFNNSCVLVVLVKNECCEVNCTFNVHKPEIFGTTSSGNLTGWTENISSISWTDKIPDTSSMSLIATYAIVCGFSALVFCVSGYIVKRVRKRARLM